MLANKQADNKVETRHLGGTMNMYGNCLLLKGFGRLVMNEVRKHEHAFIILLFWGACVFGSVSNVQQADHTVFPAVSANPAVINGVTNAIAA